MPRLALSPKCLPLAAPRVPPENDVKPPIAELGETTVPNYDSEERDYLIRTIVFEAADEPDEGKAAVAYVILNRKMSGMELGGYRVKRGYTVFMSQWVNHGDPKYFDDPEAFRPERWEHGLAKRLPKFAYYP